MKWFLIQSLFLALGAFGLGALFHRLLWKKTTGVSSSSSTAVNTFGSATNGALSTATRDEGAARLAELGALRTEHTKTVAERTAKAKELAALSFEHSAARTALADRDASVAMLRGEIDTVKAAASSEASIEIQGLVGQVDTHRSTIDELNAKLATATNEHDAAIATLRGDYDGRLGDLASAHDVELTAARNDAEARLLKATADHDAAMVGLRADHDRAMQEAHGDRDRMLSGLRSDHERALAELRRRADTAESELAKVSGDCDSCNAELARLRAERDATQGEVQRLMLAGEAAELDVTQGEVQSFAAGSVDHGSDDAFEGEDVAADDLLRIEGIGPKISEILAAGGVRTFRRLAAMPEDRVVVIVNAGGVSVVPSANTWAAQAALLRDGDEAGFQALVDRLVGGRDDAR